MFILHQIYWRNTFYNSDLENIKTHFRQGLYTHIKQLHGCSRLKKEGWDEFAKKLSRTTTFEKITSFNTSSEKASLLRRRNLNLSTSLMQKNNGQPCFQLLHVKFPWICKKDLLISTTISKQTKRTSILYGRFTRRKWLDWEW